MDEYSSRKSACGILSRKGPGLVLGDSAQASEKNRDHDVQVCSRVGCSSRLNPTKGAEVGSASKAKTSKAGFHPSHGKDIIGSSSRIPAAVTTPRRSFLDQKKKLPCRVETGSLQEESEEVSEAILTSGKAHVGGHSELEDGEIAEAGTSSSGCASRFVKGTVCKYGLDRQDNQASHLPSFAVKHANQMAGNSCSASRYGLRSLRCNSVSDVVPSGGSSSSVGRKRDVGRKRIGEAESSCSAKGKKMSGIDLDDRRNDNSSQGISISDSRRTQNMNASGANDPASVRSRRFIPRSRLSIQESRNQPPMIESPILTPSSPQSDASLGAVGFSFEDPFTPQVYTTRATSFTRSSSESEQSYPNRPVSPHEVGFACSIPNRDTLRQFNLDGIAEMLLALERIGQEEEPTYEQLLVLETNLFLGGLALRDQHRDMRLDIDNMSYEELLALEERMGTVSTGVPEEALTECLQKDVYQDTEDFRGDVDDIRCSICQEEYADGEEVGRLRCDHRYHIECIHQWLRLKNWCPICKACATPSPRC